MHIYSVSGHTLNGQPLLEFPMSSGEPALEPLRIKRATLWARVELKHSHHYQHHRHNQINQRNITLWVFRVHCGNTTHLRGKVICLVIISFTSHFLNSLIKNLANFYPLQQERDLCLHIFSTLKRRNLKL